MQRDGIYKTSDFYAAAFLLFKGFQLQGMDRSNKQRNDFVFTDRPDRPELVHSFMTGQAVGNLAEFIYHLKRAKRLLYSVEV